MNRSVRFSFATGLLTGTATISVHVPGTFNGMTRNYTAPNGRGFISACMFCSSPAAGDYAGNFQVLDNDSVVPSGLQSLFPSYPLISAWGDPGESVSNVGLWLDPSGGPTSIPSSGGTVFCPAGLYLTATFQKASVGVYTVYLDIIWDDYT